jgi:S1-C subfamily serine protease
MLYRMTIAGLGGTATLTRVRNGDVQEVEVAMIAPPDEPPRATHVTTAYLPGITLEQINPAVSVELGLPIIASGVVVSDPGETGARAGLRKGNILLGINREKVLSPAQADALLQTAKGRLVLTLQRGEGRVTLRFRI